MPLDPIELKALAIELAAAMPPLPARQVASPNVDVEIMIDRVRTIGDLLVSCGDQSVNANTLPTVGGMLFELADQLKVAFLEARSARQ